MLLAARQSSAPGARGGAGSGSSMPQVALVLEVTLFPPLAGVAAAAGAGRRSLRAGQRHGGRARPGPDQRSGPRWRGPDRGPGPRSSSSQ